MKKTLYSVALALIATLTISSGALHGYLDGRWTGGADFQAAAARLPALPAQCGPWMQVNDQRLPPTAEEMLRCYGYINREYLNSATGERVSVAVLFGPRGPIAVHTPEICYSSAGTLPIGDRTVETVKTENVEDQLWRVRFARHEDPQPFLEVWYAWSDGGAWQASENPRFWMTDRLYKIQLAGRPTTGGNSFPCRDFLTSFLPALREAIRTP